MRGLHPNIPHVFKHYKGNHLIFTAAKTLTTLHEEFLKIKFLCILFRQIVL